jgi:hypothetical protein
VTARRALLDGLARDADIFQLAASLRPCTREQHLPRRGVPPPRRGRAGLLRGQPDRPAALRGTPRAVPARDHLPRPGNKIQYAVRAAAALHGGTEPDLLDEVTRWQTGDFWQYALFAAVAHIRAASRAGVPARQASQDLAQRPSHPDA